LGKKNLNKWELPLCMTPEYLPKRFAVVRVRGNRFETHLCLDGQVREGGNFPGLTSGRQYIEIVPRCYFDGKSIKSYGDCLRDISDAVNRCVGSTRSRVSLQQIARTLGPDYFCTVGIYEKKFPADFVDRLRAGK